MPSKLSEISTRIFSGGTPSTQCDEYWGGDIPWLSSGETSNRYIVKTQNHITLEGVENSSTKLAKKNTIVIASAGQGLTRGQTSLLCLDTYINQSIIAIEINPALANPLFVFFNISTRYEELRSISDGTSSRGSLTTKLIGELEIDLPERDVQDKIAYLISTIDGKIRTDQSINDNLLKLGKQIFQNWQNHCNQMIEIRKVANEILDYTPNTNSKIYLLNSSDVTEGVFDNNTLSENCSLKGHFKKRFNKGDTLLSEVRPANRHFGFVSFNSELYIASTRLIVLRKTPMVLSSEVLYFMIIDDDVQNEYNQLTESRSGTFPQGCYDDLASIQIPYSDLNTQQKMLKELTPILQLYYHNLDTINKLIMLKNNILPKLMSGEIDVSILEIPN